MSVGWHQTAAAVPLRFSKQRHTMHDGCDSGEIFPRTLMLLLQAKGWGAASPRTSTEPQHILGTWLSVVAVGQSLSDGVMRVYSQP